MKNKFGNQQKENFFDSIPPISIENSDLVYDKNTFYLVFLDPEHNFYKSKKK